MRDPLTEEDLLTNLDNEQEIGWPMKEYLVPPNAILVPNLLGFEQCTDLSSHFGLPKNAQFTAIKKIKELQELVLKTPQRRWVSWQSTVKKCSVSEESKQKIDRRRRELSLEGGEKEVIDFTTEALFLKRERNGKEDGMFEGMVVMFGVNHLQNNSIQLSSVQPQKRTPYYPIIWDCAKDNNGITNLKAVVETIIYRQVNQVKNDAFDAETINNQMDEFLKKYYFPEVDPNIQTAFINCVRYQKESREKLTKVNLNKAKTNVEAVQAYEIALKAKKILKLNLEENEIEAKKAYKSFFNHIASLSWNVQLDLEIEVARILLFKTIPNKHAEKVVKDCVPLNCPDKYPLNLECSMGMEVQFTITNSEKDQKKDVLTLYLHHLQRFCVFPEYCVPNNLYKVDLDRVLQPRLSTLNPEDLQNNKKENDSYTRIMINLLDSFRKASNADALLLHDVLKIDNYHVSLYNASQCKLGFYTSYINGLKLVKNYRQLNYKTIEQATKAGIQTIRNALGTVTRNIECYEDEEVEKLNDEIFSQKIESLKEVFESKEYPLVKYFKNKQIQVAWKFASTLSDFLRLAKILKWMSPAFKDVTGDLTFDGLLYALLGDLDVPITRTKEERQYLNDLEYGRYYMYNPVVPQPSGLWIREVPTSYLQFKNLMQVFKPERPNVQPLLFVDYPWTKESKAYAKSRKRLQLLQIRSRKSRKRLQWLQIRSRSRRIKRSKSRSKRSKISKSRSRSKSKSRSIKRSESGSKSIKRSKSRSRSRSRSDSFDSFIAYQDAKDKEAAREARSKRMSKIKESRKRCMPLQTFLEKCFVELLEKDTSTRIGLRTEMYYVSISIDTLTNEKTTETRATCRRGPDAFVDLKVDSYDYDPKECINKDSEELGQNSQFPRKGKVNFEFDLNTFKIYVFYPRSDTKKTPRNIQIVPGAGFDYFKFSPVKQEQNRIVDKNFTPFSTSEEEAQKLYAKSKSSTFSKKDIQTLERETVDPAYDGFSYYCVNGNVHTLYLFWHLDKEWIPS